MKTTIQIKSTSGDVLYEHTCEDNSVKKAVEEAVKNNVSLRGANLSGADLRKADLRGANLRGADLRKADLRGAFLPEANLRYANLRYAYLRYAYLSGANLCYANLRYAYLRYAYLSGANLSGANLRDADLSNVKADHTTTLFFSQCPDGEFVGYKKAGGKIVKLLIPSDAKRSSATTLKCRCSKAKVLEIQELDGSLSEVKEVRSNYDKDFVYRIGETVCVEDFDDDRWNECSTGIHFFISRDAAVSY